MNQKVAVFVLLIFQAMLAAIIVAEPESLGLNKIVVGWMSIFNIGVGVALNQLDALFSIRRNDEGGQTINVTNIVPKDDEDAV